MLHYASGTPQNDFFQVLENQLARQRLFSVHPTHFKPVLTWVDDLADGLLTFDDQLARTPSLRGLLERRDARMREELSERGYDPRTWVPCEDALRGLSNTLAPGYPKRIMLDSGAFTDWGQGRLSSIDDVVHAYSTFLERAGDLFDEVYLINLDVIPGEKGRQATDVETVEAIKQSDANYTRLTSEFDVPVLPVFHQGEPFARLHEVVDMASGYICLSPHNERPQKVRENWAAFHTIAIPNVRCHGLATTGNRMMRIAGLYSGDSTSWRIHSGNGTIDVRWNDRRTNADLNAPPLTPYYRPAHVAIGRNEFDGKRLLPNHEDHVTELDTHEQMHIRARAERYLPFPMVQLDPRAMNIVSLGEIQSVAEDAYAPAA